MPKGFTQQLTFEIILFYCFFSDKYRAHSDKIFYYQIKKKIKGLYLIGQNIFNQMVSFFINNGNYYISIVSSKNKWSVYLGQYTMVSI
jgi:hypothetical protein